jgi:hypothetical protein
MEHLNKKQKTKFRLFSTYIKADGKMRSHILRKIFSEHLK